MSLSDDNSLVGVVILPALGGIVGFVLFGPLGFFAGVVLPLVLGAHVQRTKAKKGERIEDLEARVEELEAESN